MTRKARRAAIPLSDLVARIIGPVAAKRGFATTDLIASWPEVAGARVAAHSRPERIAWPPRDRDAPGTLVLRVDGPAAVLIQHEGDQIVDRVNTFMGYRAVDRMRIVQGPLPQTGKTANAAPPAVQPANVPEEVTDHLAEIGGDGALRRALERLAHGVFTGGK